VLGIHSYPLFVLAGVLLNLTPGQDTFFVLGQSLAGGRRAGVAAAVGIAVGSVGHTFAAALGLSALLAASPGAFFAVRLAGAAYLVYLGTRALMASAEATLMEAARDSTRPASAFRRGVVTNLLNPKVALFFLALMPQFIAVDSSTKVLAFLVLGLTFVSTGLAWCMVLACAAAAIRALLVQRPAARAALPRVAGGLFIILGLRLAVVRP